MFLNCTKIEWLLQTNNSINLPSYVSVFSLSSYNSSLHLHPLTLSLSNSLLLPSIISISCHSLLPLSLEHLSGRLLSLRLQTNCFLGDTGVRQEVIEIEGVFLFCEHQGEWGRSKVTKCVFDWEAEYAWCQKPLMWGRVCQICACMRVGICPHDDTMRNTNT